MRVVQPAGVRGSLKWLQRAVNHRPELLEHPAIGGVTWLSPLESDDFAEYRDAKFLEVIGHSELVDALSAFWPKRGPQWDALGRRGDAVVLVEAKAHLDEMFSSPCAAGPASRARIQQSLTQTAGELRARPGLDWAERFYQLANRLAHLQFLRKHKIDARLLLVGFVKDKEMNGPTTASEWMAAYRTAAYAMGLPNTHRLSAFIHHIYPDVASLER